MECDTCKAFKRGEKNHYSKNQRGECRFNPPQFLGMIHRKTDLEESNLGQWPEVKSDDWCMSYIKSEEP